MLNIDGNEFSNTQYGVFVGNTAKDNMALESAKSLLQAGIQSDKVSLSEAIGVLNSDSLSDIRVSLQEGEERTIKRQEQATQSAQASAENIAKQNAQTEQAKMDLDRENNIRDNQTKLDIAFKPEAPEFPEVQDNSLEIRKLDQAQSQHKDKMRLDEEKNKIARDKIEQDLGLKREDLKIKKKAANNKPAPSK